MVTGLAIGMPTHRILTQRYKSTTRDYQFSLGNGEGIGRPGKQSFPNRVPKRSLGTRQGEAERAA
jgi:hypothetical protein